MAGPICEGDLKPELGLVDDLAQRAQQLPLDAPLEAAF